MSPEARASRLSDIREYPTTSDLTPLSKVQQMALESPIVPSEIETTVKSLPSGKSPGPNRYTRAY